MPEEILDRAEALFRELTSRFEDLKPAGRSVARPAPIPGGFVRGTWENESCSVNETGWFPLPKPWPICPARFRRFRPSPPARRGFTRFDQVDQLIEAREADPDLGFMARTMALCSLPRSNPGNRKEYKRVNGPFTLYMVAGGGNKLPYGNLPRLLLAWVCTEAVQTRSRVLVLGCSLAEFMRSLGVYNSSARTWGRSNPPPQPNGPALSYHRPVDLRR